MFELRLTTGIWKSNMITKMILYLKILTFDEVDKVVRRAFIIMAALSADKERKPFKHSYVIWRKNCYSDLMVEHYLKSMKSRMIFVLLSWNNNYCQLSISHSSSLFKLNNVTLEYSNYCAITISISILCCWIYRYTLRAVYSFFVNRMPIQNILNRKIIVLKKYLVISDYWF